MRVRWASWVVLALCACRGSQTENSGTATSHDASVTSSGADASGAVDPLAQPGIDVTLQRFYRRISSRRDAAAMTAVTEQWRRFFAGPARTEPPMPVEFVGADGTTGFTVTTESLAGSLTWMNATRAESDCMDHRGVLVTPDGDIALDNALFGRQFDNGGLECEARHPRLVGDPARAPAVITDGNDALLLVRTGGAWAFARPITNERCAAREVDTVCGRAMYCEEGGAMMGVVPPLDARSARCLSGALEVEKALDAAIQEADTRAAGALSAVIDTARDAMVELSESDASCANRDRAALDRAKALVRTRFIDWAIAHGESGAARGAEAALRRRAASGHPPTIQAHCPTAQGAFVLTAGFDGDHSGPGAEVFVTTKTVWRFDGRAVAFVAELDPREIYGSALADVDGDQLNELVVYVHGWESASQRILAFSAARSAPMSLWIDEAREGRSRHERVLVARDDARTVLLVNWIAHRWTGNTLAPTQLQSASHRAALSRRSSAQEARGSARDALAHRSLDASALDDALTVGGVSAERVQALLSMVRP